MARLFGTDGVRGIANEELTPLMAMQLGQAGAYVLTKQTQHKPTIMVGCDTRISGDMLANALMAGVCSVGANAVYEKSKSLTFASGGVTILSALNDSSRAQIEALAEELCK